MSYNRIMVHNVKYNGLTFLNSPYFRPVGGFLCLKEFSFFEVATVAATEKYAIRHGEYVAPTEKRNRRIRFLFDIIANSEEERRKLLRKVQRAFNPEQNPSPFNPNLWKKLTFMDVEGSERSCNCQVYKGVELSDFANEKWVGISVELITDSSEFRSTDINTITDGRNTRFGKRLNTVLPFDREYYRETINYLGVVDAPITLTCTITDATNPIPNNIMRIVHDYEGGYEEMQVDFTGVTFNVGDKIILDSDKRRIYLDQGETVEDITGLVTLGSQRPLLQVGANNVAVDTGAVFKVMDVSLERYNIF